MVTPSKPERLPNHIPAARQISAPALNAKPNPTAGPDQFANQRRPGPPNPNQDAAMAGTSVSNPPIKQELAAAPLYEPKAQDMLPPGSTPSASFFSARAVDYLRDNPQGITAPAFDLHAESPSIRKTAGIDHTKSVKISKPMLAAGASPAMNNTRDFVNPSTDLHRKIGAPGSDGAVGSPMGRGQSTSSYRPLTRPNVVDSRGPAAVAAVNRPQNINGKRPPLNDVTNASNPGSSGSAIGADPKRSKVEDGLATHHHGQQQQQQQNQPPAK